MDVDVYFVLYFCFFVVSMNFAGGCFVVTWRVAAFVGLHDLFRTRTPSIILGLYLFSIFTCLLASFAMFFISSIESI